MTDEERRAIKRTDNVVLKDDLQEWLSTYYEANLSDSMSDPLYEMFGDMADDFIENVFRRYKENLNSLGA